MQYTQGLRGRKKSLLHAAFQLAAVGRRRHFHLVGLHRFDTASLLYLLPLSVAARRFFNHAIVLRQRSDQSRPILPRKLAALLSDKVVNGCEDSEADNQEANAVGVSQPHPQFADFPVAVSVNRDGVVRPVVV